jgi:hypothetical protein
MPQLSTQDAETILKPFVCNDESRALSYVEQQQVRDAILTLVSGSDFQTLGICADSAQQAMTALGAYLKAFGDRADDLVLPEPTPNDEPIYIKFNTQRRSLHCDGYIGPYRGVLVTCQSLDLAKSGGTYGHLPLDLFPTASI